MVDVKNRQRVFIVKKYKYRGVNDPWRICLDLSEIFNLVKLKKLFTSWNLDQLSEILNLVVTCLIINFDQATYLDEFDQIKR